MLLTLFATRFNFPQSATICKKLNSGLPFYEWLDSWINLEELQRPIEVNFIEILSSDST
jgi:hypothetical protein